VLFDIHDTERETGDTKQAVGDIMRIQNTSRLLAASTGDSVGAQRKGRGMSREYSDAPMLSSPRASARKWNSMRDLVADWKKWSAAERILAIVVSLLIVAVPLGVLITGKLAV
jgi:hypothetical protein